MGSPRGRRGILCLALSAFVSIPKANATDIERVFVWQTFGTQETLKVKVPSGIRDHYVAKSRTYQYGNYVKEDPGFEVTARLAEAFEKRAQEEGQNEWQKINMVIDFVQSLQYQPEEGEYPKYPIETLHDGGGDCEDTSILLAALLDQLGIDCVLLSPPGHMAVGMGMVGLTGKHYVYAGKNYFYVETTGQNWEIGRIPDAFSGTARIYELPPATTVRHSLAAQFIEVAEAEEETTIMVSFFRSASGLEDLNTHETKYNYRVQLETDEKTLAQVLEVQYRRVDPKVQDLSINPWMRAYDPEDRFSKEWTATRYVPIQVRIFFKDGSMVQTLVNFAPKIRGQ